MEFSWKTCILHAARRAGKAGLVAVGVVFLGAVTNTLPPTWLTAVGPILASIAAFLEKLERNIREENK